MTELRFSGPLQSIVIEEGMAPIGFVRIPPDADRGHALLDDDRLQRAGEAQLGHSPGTRRIGTCTLQTSTPPAGTL